MNNGLLIVLSGPSGVGKGTIIRKVLNSDTNIVLSISATTRPMRINEKEGENYHFVLIDEFKELILKGEMLEYAMVYDNYYGTPKNKTIELLDSGRDVMLEIDTVGARNIKNMYSDALTIFLKPPSMEVLIERLRGRGTETPEVFTKRIAAVTYELEQAINYDYEVLNDDADICAKEVIEIIHNEKIKRLNK